MIYALDRFSVERVIPRNESLAIRCMSSAPVRAQRNIEYGQLDEKLYVGILPLVFDDIIPEDKELNPGSYDDYILFTEDHASRITDFLKRNKDKFQDIVVSCDYGNSRSCGVGVAIGDHFGSEYSPDLLERDLNLHVYSVLLNQLGRDFPELATTKIR